MKVFLLLRIGDIIIVNVISIFLTVFSLAGQFENDFRKEIENALRIQGDISSLFKSRVGLWGGDYDICSSIIFPELIRFSVVRDKMESLILMTFYKLHGTKFSDYSIGLFQMKPSFIEALEVELQEYGDLRKFSFIWEYPKGLNPREVREMRIERMLNLTWQIDYLICFIKLLDEIHGANEQFLILQNKKERIAFYASSYNSGYWYDLNKIKQYQNIKLYPHGKNWYDKQYNYSDVSIYCYEKFILGE